MQYSGKYDPNLVKAILTLSFQDKRTYKETAEILHISEKTVGRHVRHAKQAGFDIADLQLSAPELAAKLQPKRFLKDSGVLRRAESKQKFLTKKYLSESCERYSSGRYNYAECYRHYLAECSDKKHFCATYFKQYMKDQMKKDILENTKFFSIPWNEGDVLSLAGFVGENFRQYVARRLERFSDVQNGIDSCMKLLNSMHGNKALYEFVETCLASNPSLAFLPLAVLWKKLLLQSKHVSRSRWDKNFFDYVEARKKEFQQRELKRLGLGGEGGTAE